jgi:peptidoglycan/xylan/chitin deacetylase (PgdA/CDA1 family)
MLGRVLRPRTGGQVRKIILLYHSVGRSAWALPEHVFRSQIEWLVNMARLTSLEQLLDRDLPERLQVAITFDDGYASLHDVALPVLQSLGAVAAVFLNTGCIGAGQARKTSDAALGYYPNELFLSWRDVDHLLAEGWSVGSHGVGHLDLTCTCERAARKELAASKSMIESILFTPCTLFAYTWGRHTASLRRLVADAGYQYAFAGRHGPVRADPNPLALPRINVSNEYTMSDFKAVVCGDWDYLGWIQRMKAGL